MISNFSKQITIIGNYEYTEEDLQVYSEIINTLEDVSVAFIVGLDINNSELLKLTPKNRTIQLIYAYHIENLNDVYKTDADFLKFSRILKTDKFKVEYDKTLYAGDINADDITIVSKGIKTALQHEKLIFKVGDLAEAYIPKLPTIIKPQIVITTNRGKLNTYIDGKMMKKEYLGL